MSLLRPEHLFDILSFVSFFFLLFSGTLALAFFLITLSAFLGSLSSFLCTSGGSSSKLLLKLIESLDGVSNVAVLSKSGLSLAEVSDLSHKSADNELALDFSILATLKLESNGFLAILSLNGLAIGSPEGQTWEDETVGVLVGLGLR